MMSYYGVTQMPNCPWWLESVAANSLWSAAVHIELIKGKKQDVIFYFAS